MSKSLHSWPEDIGANPTTIAREAPDARICVFSLRNVKKELSRCHPYEFEDVICDIDNAVLLAPAPCHKTSVIQKVRSLAANRLKAGMFLYPNIESFRFKKSFDVFFMACQSIGDITWLSVIEGWKEHYRVSVCWLEEIWVSNIPILKEYLKRLSDFDYVVLNCSASVKPVQDLIRGLCRFMPTGVDVMRFCPYPNPPLRSVDVYSLGRRSTIVHEALLKSAEQREIFYIYDTMKNMLVMDHRQHRDLIANIAKRSQFFLVNPPKFNEFGLTNGQNEIGYRFFEGAASGTVMIGKRPQCEVFNEHFGWPDAVIDIPYEEGMIREALFDLGSQPERLAAIRRNNVVQSLLRHDWAYRWRAVLDIIGLEPMPALIHRAQRLKDLAEIASESRA